MANRMTTMNFGGGRITWTNALIVAGIAVVAPYFIRRFMPMLDGRMRNATTNDMALAGRDSVRDVADDLNVGGTSGTLNRTVDRVTDHLSH